MKGIYYNKKLLNLSAALYKGTPSLPRQPHRRPDRPHPHPWTAALPHLLLPAGKAGIQLSRTELPLAQNSALWEGLGTGPIHTKHWLIRLQLPGLQFQVLRRKGKTYGKRRFWVWTLHGQYKQRAEWLSGGVQRGIAPKDSAHFKPGPLGEPWEHNQESQSSRERALQSHSLPPPQAARRNRLGVFSELLHSGVFAACAQLRLRNQPHGRACKSLQQLAPEAFPKVFKRGVEIVREFAAERTAAVLGFRVGVSGDHLSFDAADKEDMIYIQ